MLPMGGDNGWAIGNVYTEIEYPRGSARTNFEAKCFQYGTTDVWVLTYYSLFDRLELTDHLGVVQHFLTIDKVIRVDLAFDQLQRPVYWIEAEDSELWLYWYNPLTSLQELILRATGNNPCCSMDEPRVELVSQSDVFLFYQRGDLVFYRLQRERYLTEHPVPHDLTDLTLVTSGRSTNYRMVLQSISVDAILFMVGDRCIGVDGDYIGYPWGTIPWDKN